MFLVKLAIKSDVEAVHFRSIKMDSSRLLHKGVQLVFIFISFTWSAVCTLYIFNVGALKFARKVTWHAPINFTALQYYEEVIGFFFKILSKLFHRNEALLREHILKYLFFSRYSRNVILRRSWHSYCCALMSFICFCSSYLYRRNYSCSNWG